MEKGKEEGDGDECKAFPSTSKPSEGNSTNNGDESSSGSESSAGGIEKTLCDVLHRMNIQDEEPPVLSGELDLTTVADFISTEQCKNIIIMVGAGISTSAGIPDFRSPKGIYSSLGKYNLPSPECLFEIGFFKANPQPFFEFAKEMFPQQFKPTLCHYFIRLLQEKGKLLRLYTQNIDTLEMVAGIPSEKVVEAHGTFYTSHCMNKKCHKKYDLPTMKEKIFSGEIPTCSDCGSVIKPDIVFFGEELPKLFRTRVQQDFPHCDLLIVIGTSLLVEPFASLVDAVPRRTPRLLINNVRYGSANSLARLLGITCGFDFDSPSNTRDVFWLGKADDGCRSLAGALGWEVELLNLFTEERAKLESTH